MRCGDFNATPDASVYRLLCDRLLDAQRVLKAHRPRATWMGRYPFHRIDHVFVSSGIDILGLRVPQTGLDTIASDHLPLIAECHIRPRACPTERPDAPGDTGGQVRMHLDEKRETS